MISGKKYKLGTIEFKLSSDGNDLKATYNGTTYMYPEFIINFEGEEQEKAEEKKVDKLVSQANLKSRVPMTKISGNSYEFGSLGTITLSVKNRRLVASYNGEKLHFEDFLAKYEEAEYKKTESKRSPTRQMSKTSSVKSIEDQPKRSITFKKTVREVGRNLAKPVLRERK